MEFCTFCLTAAVLRNLEFNLYATDIPPGSSRESTIRFPEDKRARLRRRASFARDKFTEAADAPGLLVRESGMIKNLRVLYS